MLVILSGVSGSGKDTIKKELIKRMEDVESLPSYTSRPKREGDIEGQTYYFISKPEFEEKINKNEFYEFNVHHNHYYGTSKKIMNEKIENGKIIVKDIDVNGTENLLKLLQDKIKVVTIFLRVPKNELKKRLEQREDKMTLEQIMIRLNRFDYEESKLGLYDYIIKNDNLEKTVQIIMTIIENEKKKEKAK